MAAKKIEPKEANRFMQVSRRVALAYIGAFGVAGDELGKLFDTCVTRGERIQTDARKMMKENSTQVRQFARDLQKDEKTAVEHANKNVKKVVHKVERAAA